MNNCENSKGEKLRKRKVVRKEPSPTRSKGIITELFGDSSYSGGSLLAVTNSSKPKKKAKPTNY